MPESESSISNHKKSAIYKLVRDGVPEKIQAKGGIVRVSKLQPSEMVDFLFLKLREEVDELEEAYRTGGDTIGEEGDVREVLNALSRRLGHVALEVVAEQTRKSVELGGFEQGIFLETVIDPPQPLAP